MKIYANGCSFTYGDELVNHKRDAWPMLLGNHEVFNDAVSGGTNQRTLYRTIKNSEKDYDLYLIAWTTYTRFTFYKSDDNTEVNFNPSLVNAPFVHDSFFKDWGRTLYKHWYNELYAFKLWLQQIIQLQYFLKDKNYLMINTMNNQLSYWLSSETNFMSSASKFINLHIMNDQQILDEFREIQYYVKLIDINKFYKWGDFAIVDLAQQFKTGPRHHILEEGHMYLSNLIKKHLNV